MRVTPAAGSAYTLFSKLGDDEFWQDLRLGLNYFNTCPPTQTIYRFSDLYTANAQVSDGATSDNPDNENFESILISPILMCSCFFTLLRIQVFEAGKHFEFNDNGVSISRKKQQDYGNIAAGSVLQYITTMLPLIKTSQAYQNLNIKGQFSGLIGFPRSLQKSLRGTRLGSGG
jgi:hypothetical protein